MPLGFMREVTFSKTSNDYDLLKFYEGELKDPSIMLKFTKHVTLNTPLQFRDILYYYNAETLSLPDFKDSSK
jgi:hypothetical protein